ncbi:MAG: hypothetical protein OHK0032_15010 [Thermodesulfovibrionales bacterium]
MEFSSKITLISLLFLFTVFINLPFGYLRKKARRFSFRWFLYIHLPIPFIILVRMLSQIDFRYIPIFIFASLIGQAWGGRMEF